MKGFILGSLIFSGGGTNTQQIGGQNFILAYDYPDCADPVFISTSLISHIVPTKKGNIELVTIKGSNKYVCSSFKELIKKTKKESIK